MKFLFLAFKVTKVADSTFSHLSTVHLCMKTGLIENFEVYKTSALLLMCE